MTLRIDPACSSPWMAEFHKQAGDSFEALERRIEDEAVGDFERLVITEKGVDWDDPRLRGPSATWTYLVGDNPFGASGLLSPAGRTQMLSAVAGAPWLVLAYGASMLWRRRKDRRA